MSAENNGREREAEDELFEEIERRALFALPEEEEEGEQAPDLIEALATERAGEHGTAEAGGAAAAEDLTLGGYIAKHDRVPAFEGSDGQPYTVDIDVEANDDPDRPYAAFLVFLRWAATGAGIMDHVESGDIAYGESEDDARRAVLELSLYEVRAELDAAIERRRHDLES